MSETETTLDQSGSPERIGFGKRFGAWLIDLVLSGVLGSVIGMFAGAALVGIFFGSAAAAGTGDAETAAVAGGMGAMLGGMIGSIAGMYLMMLLFMLIEGFTGQTPGKMILSIKNKNQDGSAAGTGALLLRAAMKNISTILALLAGVTGMAMLGTVGSLAGLGIFIGCFFVLGANRLSFHDMISKTAVYDK